MSLKMLEGVKKIGGFEVVGLWEGEPDPAIIVNVERSFIGFKIQDGPICEVGVNGCQVDTIIEAAKMILEGFNREFPCRENDFAIVKLDEALMCLEARKFRRELRGVEGTSEA